MTSVPAAIDFRNRGRTGFFEIVVEKMAKKPRVERREMRVALVLSFAEPGFASGMENTIAQYREGVKPGGVASAAGYHSEARFQPPVPLGVTVKCAASDCS